MKGLGCFHEQSMAEDQKPQHESQQHSEEMQQASRSSTEGGSPFVSPFIPQARCSFESQLRPEEVQQADQQKVQPKEEVPQEELTLQEVHSSGDEQVHQEGQRKEAFREECETMSFS